MIVHEDEWLTIHQGDCREVMASMEPESVQTVVTSPPYFGLRDYGLPPAIWADGWLGTLGLEPGPEMYVEHMLEVFRAVRRVLRPDGTVWLNLGDTYADRANRADVAPAKKNTLGGTFALKAKDRMMIPARVAIALQGDGWWLRDEIVWHKPNPMPMSVRDRTTPAHELVFLLSKRGTYHYDQDAIREETSYDTHPRGGRDVPAGWNDASVTPGEGAGARTAANNGKVKVPGGWEVEKGAHGRVHRGGRTEATYTDTRWPRGWAHGEGRGHDPQQGRYEAPPGHERELSATRNRRSVWTVSTQAYPDAHYATFPEALIEPMILAGAPAGAVVLDPFGGSGTVALVAQRLHRRAVLIDLSSEYLVQMVRRIAEGRAQGEGPAIDMPVPYADDGLWSQ